MFVFALGESSGKCEQLLSQINSSSAYKHLDAKGFFTLISEANVVLSQSMIDELIRLGVSSEEVVKKIPVVETDREKGETGLLVTFSSNLNRGKINLQLLNHAIKYSESKEALILQILSLIQLADFKSILF